jgi:Ca-activated chloride channel homolog
VLLAMFRRHGLVLLLPALVFAQTAEAPVTPIKEPKPIRVQVNEVIVPVTVTDEKGKFVTNLEQKDFHVFDGGEEQKIQFFSRERNQPVVIGFIIDTSNNSRMHWKNYQESAMELVWNLLPNADNKKFSGYLISYSNEAELLVNTTNDSEKIVEKLRKLKPGGGAALYDSIYMACTKHALVKGEPVEPRRIIIIIGDGNDSASKKGLDEVLEIAQRNLVTIYGISTVAYGFANEGDKNLVRLAEETGGRVEYPLQNVYKDVSGYLETPSDEGNYAYKVGTGGYASAVAQGMFRAINNVAGEVTTQYIMRYTPTIENEKRRDKIFRPIKVKVDLPNVTLRFRKGYYPLAADERK